MAETVVSRRAGDERQRALDAAITQIERAFGKGSVMRLGASDRLVEIETVSTGSLGLDIALGVGGLPRGRIVEIYGPESSGKTTLTLHVIAEAQKQGGTCAFIDAEHALDPGYARKLGVNLDELLISQARHRRAGARDRRHAGPLRAPSTSSSSTAWRRWCPRPSSRARWATAMWASRPAS